MKKTSTVVYAFLSLALTGQLVNVAIAEKICVYNQATIEKTKQYKAWWLNSHPLSADAEKFLERTQGVSMWYDVYQFHVEQGIELSRFDDNRIRLYASTQKVKLTGRKLMEKPEIAKELGFAGYSYIGSENLPNDRARWDLYVHKWLDACTRMNADESKAKAALKLIEEAKSSLRTKNNAIAVIAISVPIDELDTPSGVEYIDVTEDLVKELNE